MPNALTVDQAQAALDSARSRANTEAHRVASVMLDGHQVRDRGERYRELVAEVRECEQELRAAQAQEARR